MSNEPAERFRNGWRPAAGWSESVTVEGDDALFDADFDAALAAERRVTVERIRAAFEKEWEYPNPGQSMSRGRRKAMLDWAEARKRRTLAILDAEAQR